MQAAVAVLLARKASPALRSWPSAGGPPLTPADMAAAGGHTGLAALLAEAQLRELLAGLKSDSRRQGTHGRLHHFGQRQQRCGSKCTRLRHWRQCADLLSSTLFRSTGSNSRCQP